MALPSSKALSKSAVDVGMTPFDPTPTGMWSKSDYIVHNTTPQRKEETQTCDTFNPLTYHR